MSPTSNDHHNDQARERCKRSRALSRRLLAFSGSMTSLRLQPHENAIRTSRQLLLAAQLCQPRGEYHLARKLLIRGYALAKRYTLLSECTEIARKRMELEEALNNTPAIRLWRKRLGIWQDRLEQDLLNSAEERRVYYREVLCCTESRSMRQYSSHHQWREIRHILTPYQSCTERNFEHAIRLLDQPTIQNTSSVLLANERTWLHFRILCSLGSFEEAKKALEHLNSAPSLSRRLKEYQRIGHSYLELHTMLGSFNVTTEQFLWQGSNFMSSFRHVQQEPGGMMVALCILEICSLILDSSFDTADKRLAALRVRLCRQSRGNEVEDVRIFLRVINHIIATHHRYRKVQPAKLIRQLQERSVPVRYALQGIIPYDLLAVRLLRYMGYTS